MPYKDKNKEKEYRKKYRLDHKEDFKKYYNDNRDRINKYTSEWNKKNPNKKAINKKYNESLRGRYNASKCLAKRRNKSFTITFEEFCELIKLPCHYCNDKFNSKSITGCGLDRLDNRIGYEFENVRSCCKVCNAIKNEHLSVEETMVAVNAIIEYRKNNITCDL